jgi:two-component system, OmpR family, response regulator
LPESLTHGSARRRSPARLLSNNHPTFGAVSNSPAVKKEKVLSLGVFIVEDGDAMRELLVDVFGIDDRFQVLGTAKSEAEAKRWLNDHAERWDLVVVDLMLSDGAGLGVISTARRTHLSGCIVVFSAYCSALVEKHCYTLGADVVFDKARTSEFLAWVRRVADADADLVSSDHQSLSGDHPPPN